MIRAIRSLLTMRANRSLLAAASLLAGTFGSAMAQTGSVERAVEATMIVETIDRQKRQVLLRGTDSALHTVVAGPEVQRLDEVNPGDRVHIRFERALLARIARPGSAVPGPEGRSAVGRAIGGAPAGVVMDEVSARVHVDAIDRGNGTVTVRGPEGLPRVLVARSPEILQFLRTVRVGDDVDVTYSEAVAIVVEPMR